MSRPASRMSASSMSDSDASYHGMPGGGSHSSPARTAADDQHRHNGDGYESDPYQPPGQQQHDPHHRNHAQSDSRGRNREARTQQQNGPRVVSDLQGGYETENQNQNQNQNQNRDRRQPKPSSRPASVVRGVLKARHNSQVVPPVPQMQMGPSSSGRLIGPPPGIAPPQGSQLIIKPSYTGRTSDEVGDGYRDFPSNRQRARSMMGPSGHRQPDLGRGAPSHQMHLAEPDQLVGHRDMRDDDRTRRGSQDSEPNGRYEAHRSEASDNVTSRGGGPGIHNRQRRQDSPDSEPDGRYQAHHPEASDAIPGGLASHRRRQSAAPGEGEDEDDSEDNFNEDGYPRRRRRRHSRDDDDPRMANARGGPPIHPQHERRGSQASSGGMTSVVRHLTPNGTHYIPASPGAYGEQQQQHHQQQAQYINPRSHIQIQPHRPIHPRRGGSLQQVAVPPPPLSSSQYPPSMGGGYGYGYRPPYGGGEGLGHVRTPGPYGIHPQQHPQYRAPQYMQIQQAAGPVVAHGYSPSRRMFPGPRQASSFGGRGGMQSGFFGGGAPMAFAPGMF